jgi:hypothetical protein
LLRLDQLDPIFEKARSAVGSAEWERTLERLRAVREITRMDRVLDRYEELLASLRPPG